MPLGTLWKSFMRTIIFVISNRSMDCKSSSVLRIFANPKCRYSISMVTLITTFQEQKVTRLLWSMDFKKLFVLTSCEMKYVYPFVPSRRIFIYGNIGFNCEIFSPCWYSVNLVSFRHCHLSAWNNYNFVIVIQN